MNLQTHQLWFQCRQKIYHEWWDKHAESHCPFAAFGESAIPASIKLWHGTLLETKNEFTPARVLRAPYQSKMVNPWMIKSSMWGAFMKSVLGGYNFALHQSEQICLRNRTCSPMVFKSTNCIWRGVINLISNPRQQFWTQNQTKGSRTLL